LTNSKQTPTFIQQSINPNVTITKNDIWGHCLPKKTDGILRIGVKNINSLPLSSTHNKNDLFINDIMEGEMDIFCATEINICWKNIPHHHQIKERFQGKLEMAKYVPSYNKDEHYKEQFQRGGTLTVCLGHTCARTIQTGTDIRNLGRWSWIQVRGSKGLNLIVATLYRPVKSTGALSTYQQQKNVLLSN
jgi:hypothetical protein